MEFNNRIGTKKELIRRILNSWLSDDDTLINCCRTFIKMKMYEDCFADFGLTVNDVLRLSEMKRRIEYEINWHLDHPADKRPDDHPDIS